LIYCAGGVRSADAAVQLRSKGYTVYELSGGINRYKKEGLPVNADEVVQQLSTSNYDKMILSAETILVDFGAPWCPPCRKMEPVLAELQKSLDSNFKLQKIDGGIHIELMKSLQVEALPHFIVYKKGIKTWEKQGIVSLEELKKAIL
jgi:thioredoxin-like negative regulator of GroEL